jgi:hypothetical protein
MANPLFEKLQLKSSGMIPQEYECITGMNRRFLVPHSLLFLLAGCVLATDIFVSSDCSDSTG